MGLQAKGIVMMCVQSVNAMMFWTTEDHSELIVATLCGLWHSEDVHLWTVLSYGGGSDESVT